MTSTEIIEIIRHYGDFAGNAELAAIEWEAGGFSAAQVDEWLGAGCFEAGAATLLSRTGLSAAEASERITDGEHPLYGCTIGYAVSNGDMTASEAYVLADRS